MVLIRHGNEIWNSSITNSLYLNSNSPPASAAYWLPHEYKVSTLWLLIKLSTCRALLWGYANHAPMHSAIERKVPHKQIRWQHVFALRLQACANLLDIKTSLDPACNCWFNHGRRVGFQCTMQVECGFRHTTMVNRAFSSRLHLNRVKIGECISHATSWITKQQIKHTPSGVSYVRQLETCPSSLVILNVHKAERNVKKVRLEWMHSSWFANICGWGA